MTAEPPTSDPGTTDRDSVALARARAQLGARRQTHTWRSMLLINKCPLCLIFFFLPLSLLSFERKRVGRAKERGVAKEKHCRFATLSKHAASELLINQRHNSAFFLKRKKKGQQHLACHSCFNSTQPFCARRKEKKKFPPLVPNRSPFLTVHSALPSYYW